MEGSEVVLVHPNREKPAAKATKSAIVLLLIATAVLTLIVVVGGWAALAGAEIFSIAYVFLCLLMAYYVAKWSRGVLAVAAGLAILFTVLTLVAAPGWFARDKDGFDDPLLPAAILGLFTLVLIPVQLLLVGFAMRGFNQNWNVEVEVTKEEAEQGVAEKFDEEGTRIDEDEDEEHRGGTGDSASGGAAETERTQALSSGEPPESSFADDRALRDEGEEEDQPSPGEAGSTRGE